MKVPEDPPYWTVNNKFDRYVHTIRALSLPLSSAFRLRYNTLLKLYKMEVLQPEALISRSFYAFQRREQLQPSLDRQVRAIHRRVWRPSSEREHSRLTCRRIAPS